MFSASAIVSVWYGATKNQLTSSDATTAATAPTTLAADRGDRQHERQDQQQLGRQRDVVTERHRDRDQQRKADARSAATQRSRAAGRGRARPAERWSIGGHRLVACWAITWMSTSPARRVTRATNEPWTQLVPAAAPGRTEHQLRRLLAPGERGKRLGGVVADDLVHRAAELVDEPALRRQRLRIVVVPARRRRRCAHRSVAADTAGHARCAADQRFAAGNAGDADDDALARLPRVGRCRGRRGSSCSDSSTRSATHSSASSRSAPRLPGRK